MSLCLLSRRSSWVSILNNIAFLSFVLDVSFSRVPHLNLLTPCSKARRRGSPQGVPCELRGSSLSTVTYTSQQLVLPSNLSRRKPKITPDECIHRRRVVHGFKVWRSSFCNKHVSKFRITRLEHSRVLLPSRSTLSSRVYGRFSVGTFVRRDPYRQAMTYRP